MIPFLNAFLFIAITLAYIASATSTGTTRRVRGSKAKFGNKLTGGNGHKTLDESLIIESHSESGRNLKGSKDSVPTISLTPTLSPRSDFTNVPKV